MPTTPPVVTRAHKKTFPGAAPPPQTPPNRSAAVAASEGQSPTVIALVGRCRGLRRSAKINMASQDGLGQGPACSALACLPVVEDPRGACPPCLHSLMDHEPTEATVEDICLVSAEDICLASIRSWTMTMSCLSRRHLSCLNCRHLSCLNSRHLPCLNSGHQHQHSSLGISIQHQQSGCIMGFDNHKVTFRTDRTPLHRIAVQF